MEPANFPIPDTPTPAWLTAVLRDSGILAAGVVSTVESSAASTFNSRTAFLRLDYSVDAPPNVPTRLVLKRNAPGAWSAAAGADEVRFYQTILQFEPSPRGIPTCYAAGYDSASGDSFLLLQDLSETHRPPVTRDALLRLDGVPSAAAQEAVIDTLAALHAFWWDHARLRGGDFEVGYWSRDSQRFHQYLDKRSRAWQRVISTHGERLPAETHAFYGRLIERLPVFYRAFLAPRFRTLRNLTLIHGDAYFCNFLCLVMPGSAPAYLLDWQSASGDLAALDLVNLLAAFWTREQRQEGNRELALLRRYHQGLLANGVKGYAWDDLAADYRAALIFWVLMPVQDGADGADWSYWTAKMACLRAAFEDWNCTDMLSSIS